MTIKIAEPKSVNLCATRLSRISDVMQEQVDLGAFSGITTLVARRSKIVHFEQFGNRDRENNLAMQPDTLFRMYSMSKPIICTALMTLYEQGKCDLKTPVANYIPAFGQLKVLEKDESGKEKLVDLKQPITIHHLLTHTSGLVYDFSEEYSVCDMYRENRLFANAHNTSLENLVDNLCKFPLAFQPGTQWYYSVSIDVIGRLIEIISGKTLSDFLRETIFEPLGMTDTGFYVPKEKQKRVAAMYGGVDLWGENVSWSTLMDVWERGVNEHLDVSDTDPIDNPNFARGGSGLKSSAEDYFHFAQMLLNKGELNGHRILGPKTVDFMHLNHLDPSLLPIGFANFKLPGIGFGLGSRVVLNTAEDQLIGSNGAYGWAGAAKTYYWVDPKEEIIGLFLTQYMCNFSTIERAFQALVYQSIIG